MVRPIITVGNVIKWNLTHYLLLVSFLHSFNLHSFTDFLHTFISYFMPAYASDTLLLVYATGCLDPDTMLVNICMLSSLLDHQPAVLESLIANQMRTVISRLKSTPGSFRQSFASQLLSDSLFRCKFKTGYNSSINHPECFSNFSCSSDSLVL